MSTEDGGTKGEKRDAKRRKRRKMRVVGRSVRVLQGIIMRRAERLRGRGDGGSDSDR